MVIIARAIILSINNTQLIKQSSDAVNASNEAEARSIMNTYYAELLANYYSTNPETAYDNWADDLAWMKGKVEAATKGKTETGRWTVKVTEDGKGFDVEQVYKEASTGYTN